MLFAKFHLKRKLLCRRTLQIILNKKKIFFPVGIDFFRFLRNAYKSSVVTSFLGGRRLHSYFSRHCSHHYLCSTRLSFCVALLFLFSMMWFIFFISGSECTLCWILAILLLLVEVSLSSNLFYSHASWSAQGPSYYKKHRVRDANNRIARQISLAWDTEKVR